MVKFLTNLGLYLHIPFCKRKCAYCDFYSAVFNDTLAEDYTQALQREIKQWGGKQNRPIDTIYFGGGTPSLLNHRILPILDTVNTSFKVQNNAEITLEVNPQYDIEAILKNAVYALDKLLSKIYLASYLFIPPNLFAIYAGMYQ